MFVKEFEYIINVTCIGWGWRRWWFRGQCGWVCDLYVWHEGHIDTSMSSPVSM